MEQLDWKKILSFLFIGYCVLTLCRSFSRVGSPASSIPDISDTRNQLATLRAENPLVGTIEVMQRTESAERRRSLTSPTATPTNTRVVHTIPLIGTPTPSTNFFANSLTRTSNNSNSDTPYLDSFMTQFYESEDQRILGTPFSWIPPSNGSNSVARTIVASTLRPNHSSTPRPSFTPRPTSTRRGTTPSTTTTNNRPTSPLRDTAPRTLFSFADYIDVDNFQSQVAHVGIRWILVMLGAFGILLLLNANASNLVVHSGNLITSKGKQTFARTTMLLYGVVHLVIIAGFYSGVVLWLLGFTSIFLRANRSIDLNILDIVIFILTLASWIFVIGGILRGFRAFHVPDGRNRYILLPDEAPKLYDLLAKIADELGVKAVDEIRLVPEVQFKLYERGLWLPFPFVKRRRVLVLGMASLQNLTVARFSTLMRVQYRLFERQGSDLWAGALIVRGRDNMSRMIRHMQEINYNRPLNFIWYSFLAFEVAYQTATSDMVKLHVLLTDCIVASEHDNLNEGISHLDFLAQVYRLHSRAQITASITNRAPLLNVYQTMFNNEKELELAARAYERELTNPPVYSGRYPATYIRFQATSQPEPELSADQPTELTVTSMFVDGEGLMTKMTILMMRQLPPDTYKGKV